MTTARSSRMLAARVQGVVDLVETILADIATENADLHETAPAMVEFISELQMRIVRIMNERLGAFIRHKHQPDD